MEKYCLDCGEVIQGRSDKKFCNDQCRNSYNNIQNTDANNFMRTVNRILRKNRLILCDLNPSGKTKTHRDKLLEKGFNFSYHTHIMTTKSGSVYRFCYEQGILELDNNFILLVERRDETETKKEE
jgi:predicted nucleic acid-binding Zn ribbon protein